jgi:glycosyltransferase involved in cell wall biosynthesis
MAAISVIIPCYNRAVLVRAAIESVIRQDFSDWELIAVDDGSDDQTFDVLKHYAVADRRIHAFRTENGGVSAARNFGAAQSSSSTRYLFFLDSDDELEPNALRQMSDYLDQHPEVGLVGCQFQDITADGRRLGTGERSRWAPGKIFPRKLSDEEAETPFAVFFCGTGQGPFAMYRKNVFEKTTGWEIAFSAHEDTDMFCQMALLSKVHFLPDRLYLKREHPEQLVKKSGLIEAGYAKFRQKWDNFAPRTEEEAAALKNATRYYYSLHRPCRDLKVAAKAFREFLSNWRYASLCWCLKLFSSAARGFLGYGRPMQSTNDRVR